MIDVLFCGLATALGWGLRGEFGGPKGATIPGALLGLSLCVASGDPALLRAAPLMGAVGALAFAPGGTLSYGIIIGYTRGTGFWNVVYGYAMLGVVGGLWGCLGAGLLGLVTGPAALTPLGLGAGIALAFVLGSALYAVFITWLGWRISPPRPDAWPRCLAACAVLLGYALWAGDLRTVRLCAWGGLSGAAGFMVGQFLQVLGTERGPEFDWWKVMEQVFGLVLGGGIAWAFLREAPASVPDLSATVLGVSVAVLAVGVPYLTLVNALGHWHRKGMPITKEESCLRALRTRVLWLLALPVPVCWWFARVEHVPSGAVSARVWLLALVWVTVLLGVLKTAYPDWWSWTTRWVHRGFLALALLVTGWAVLSASASAPPFQARGTSLVSALLLAGTLPVVALALARLSIATHPGVWPRGAHRRFGGEPDPELDS